MKNEHKYTNQDFKIEQLFGSKTRVRLLGLLLENAERSFYVREITRRIEAQLNSVRRELVNLIEIGIILEVEGDILEGEKERTSKTIKKVSKTKKKFYTANSDFSFFNELRSILKKSSVLTNKDFVRELQEKGKMQLLFLTGTFIDDKEAPSDVLVVGEISQKKLQNAIEGFEKQIGREINYTFMSDEEYLYRKDIKDRFLMSLIQTDKIVLINAIDEEL